MEERAFRGIWTPSEVWLDERLTALDKTILMEIDSLDDGVTGCVASNEYLASFCVCSPTKVSKSISKLVKLGFVEQVGFNGRTRILKSRLAENARQTCKKCKADLQKVQGDNKVIDNTNLYTEKKPSKKEIASFDALIGEYTTDEDLKTAIVEFIKMRKLIKKPLTNRALSMVLKKLDGLANTNEDKIAILNQSIEHSWQTVYPYSSGAKPPKKESDNKSFDANEFLAAALNKKKGGRDP